MSEYDPFNPNHVSQDDIADVVHESAGNREQIEEQSSDQVKHFRLMSKPFADNVNPEFFFRTEAHEEAFLTMKRCIEDHVSLGLTTAIAGTGKTMLTQVLLQQLDPRKYQSVLILAYPGMTRGALLRDLAAELKIEDLGQRPTTHSLISAIQGHIIQQYIKGRRLILIIDEVHFLGADTLHILRTLSNIEVPEQKLVTVLLFGEQSFMTKLKRPNFASVFSRTFARVEIRPLTLNEIRQYIKFRLLMSGGRPEIFDEGVFELIYEHSRGIPREVNRICHNALTQAARRGQPAVNNQTINQLKESGKI